MTAGRTADRDVPEPPEVGPRSAAADVVALSLRSGARRLVDQEAAVRGDEPDAVHQMRVATRRLRSDLRTFGPLVDPEWAGELRERLSWLADLLAPARDLEVLRERLQRTAGADALAPLDPVALSRVDGVLAEREQRALQQLDEGLRSTEYTELVDRVVAAARDPRTTDAAMASAGEALPPLVARTHEHFARRAQRLDDSAPDGRWHRVRILAKRARYAAEAAAPALGDGPRALGKAMASVQTLLGEHQDAVVAATTWLDVAHGFADDVTVQVTCGRLAERERAAVRGVRAAYPDVLRSASRPRLVRWLAA